ncbi:MAG: ligase-associated DNA damage response endonuclease PdeM [Pseudomonadota bacterium]
MVKTQRSDVVRAARAGSTAPDREKVLEGAAQFAVNGEEIVALTCGAAYVPAHQTLLVADLHFEKGSSFARKGVLLPPYDTRTTLKRLLYVVRALAPKRVISLGDAFHDTEAEGRMAPSDADRLNALQREAAWTWILGNHDPAPPARFKGEVAEEMILGRLFLTHEPTGTPRPGEVAGHLHPCAKVKAQSRTIRRRCFLADDRRMILPAFGAYTGGLNILDGAFEGLCDRPVAWVLGGEGVYPFTMAGLLPDPAPIARMAG